MLLIEPRPFSSFRAMIFPFALLPLVSATPFPASSPRSLPSDKLSLREAIT